jgi:hypothetical protein
MRIPLPLATYKQSGTRLLNVHPEAVNQGKAPVLLRHAPGVGAFATVPTAGFGGAVEWNDLIYLLSGEVLYSISRSGAVTSIGVVPATGRMPMVANRLAVVMANGYYTDGATVSQITDPDFVPGTDIDFLDNFLIFLRPDSDTFAISELNSTTDFDALDFAVAESRPDKLVGLIADHNQIVLAGTRTVELYWNAGTTGFTFERIPDGVVELGCVAGATLAALDNSVVWLASDGTVRALRDRTPARISQHGVECALASYGDLSAAFAFTYTLEGHLCYVLTIPGQATLVYDFSTLEWCERETLGQADWQVRGAVEAWGKTWVFDDAGRMGELSTTVYAEWGAEVRKEWCYPAVYAERVMASHGRFESAVKPGEGLVTGQGSDPTIGLDFSDDGGKTWVNLPSRSLGKIGQYKYRQVWHGLGSSRDRIYRQWVSDPVPVVLEDAVVEAVGGYI